MVFVEKEKGRTVINKRILENLPFSTFKYNVDIYLYISFGTFSI